MELDPKNVEAHVLRGNALAGLKDLDGALAQIQEAIKLNPHDTLGHVSLGAMEQAAGRSEEAEAAFTRAVEIEPTLIANHLALANFYWAARKAPETERTLRRAYQIEPDHPLVNQMLGMFQIAIGKPADAEPYLTKLAEVSKDPNARLALADYYISSRRPKDALPLLQQLTSDKKTGSAAELRLAELDFAGGRTEPAQSRVDALIAREPNNADGLILKARFLASDGKLDEAIGRLRAAVAANPGSAEAQFALGQAYAARNNRAEAIKAFNETVRLNPRATAAQVALSRLELAEGRSDSSVNFAEQALQNAPQSLAAKLALVRGLVARREGRRAEEELDPLLRRYPDNPDVLIQAGFVASLKGEDVRARRFFVNALGLREGNLEALRALVTLDLAEKKPADAVARVEALLGKAPAHPGALILAAQTYAGAGDLKKSEQALRKTIDADASNFQAYSMLGRLYLRQGRLDEALKEFDELSKREARPVQAHTLAGIILTMRNNEPEARKRYEQALSVDPEAPVAANNLAWIMAETGGNLDVALQLAQTAARRLPDHPAVQDTLGWIYYKKNLATLAVLPLQKSIEKDPKNPVYHFHLGLAHAKVGDQLNARLALQQALTLAPEFNGAAEARRALASLKG